MLAGDGDEIELGHLGEGLLPPTDTDDDVARGEEFRRLVTPVVTDDGLRGDGEAVVLRRLGAGHTGGLPAPLHRDAVGQCRDAHVGQTRNQVDRGGEGVVGQRGVESFVEQALGLLLVELLPGKTDDADVQGAHGNLSFDWSSSSDNYIITYFIYKINSDLR